MKAKLALLKPAFLPERDHQQLAEAGMCCYTKNFHHLCCCSIGHACMQLNRLHIMHCTLDQISHAGRMHAHVSALR